jgi:hypothetical protein
MDVTFTRTDRQACETVIVRDDGRSFSVPVYSVPRRLPHDLAHLAVEAELGWQTGFWGYVARGAVFPGMRQRGGRRPFHADERSRALIAPAKDLLGEAENLVAVITKIADSDCEDDERAVARTFADSWFPPQSRARQLPTAEVRRACAALRRAESAWQALAVGESLKIRWSLRRGPHAPEHPGARPLARRRPSAHVHAAARR